MAITILVWCMNCVKVPAGSDLAPRIRTSHFILALAALRKLNPADGLYIAPTDATAETFSLGEVFRTVCKILKYLARAYAPDQQVYIPSLKFPFPLVSISHYAKLDDGANLPHASLPAPRSMRCIAKQAQKVHY